MDKDRTVSVGFIGLGTMGAPMARRLLAAGFAVSVFDAVPSVIEKFRGPADCRLAASPAEAADGADILITMLPTSAHVREVLFAQKAADRLPPDALVMDMSTGDPRETVAIAQTLQSQGRRFIDAPVCRGRSEAESGQLLALVGGAHEDLDRARPVLDAMCESILHVGPVGSGIQLKLVNNYLSMVQMVVAAEGLAFAAKLGIARETALDLFSRTPAGRGQLLTNFPKKVLAGDVTADFPLSMGLKDISLALQLGADAGMPLLLGAAARELYGLAKPFGRGHEDCTAMLLLLEDLSGGGRAPHPAATA